MMHGKAIIWRELNRDVKSSKTLLMYFFVCLISLYFFSLSYNFTEYCLALVSSLLFLSVYTSVYGMSNIAVLLTVPISIREQCLAKTLYVFIKIVSITILNIFIVYILNFIGVITYEKDFISHCYVMILAILSGTCIFYFALLLLLMLNRKVFTFLLIVVSVSMYFFRKLIEDKLSIQNGLLVIILCILLGFLTDYHLMRIKSEKILIRWT